MSEVTLSDLARRAREELAKNAGRGDGWCLSPLCAFLEDFIAAYERETRPWRVERINEKNTWVSDASSAKTVRVRLYEGNVAFASEWPWGVDELMDALAEAREVHFGMEGRRAPLTD